MGPYYQATAQGVGSFFDAFYQHPILMVLLFGSVAAIGFLVWRREKSSEQSDS